eukprot:TRINITY_DN4624_c0_g1_i1.p1 TRINITY_DN4624_c0_g1~~TRINITY_DN4624_c0_g1_i1.p1  ORF type:complete len:330 (-),score=69.79 TRINITY_DN4624_c0_g1_i1:727-1668(-)
MEERDVWACLPHRGPRWESLVKPQLERVATREAEVTVEVFQEVLAAIEPRLAASSYLPFKGLALALPSCAPDFLRTTLPRIAQLALAVETLFERLPEQRNVGEAAFTCLETALTHEQVACLLANALFGTFGDNPLLSSFCFHTVLHNQHTATLLGILHYFERVCHTMPPGRITIRRQSLSAEQIPNWRECDASMCPLQVDLDLRIEDALDHLQVDFANRAIGGGVLRGGCAQEEIRFGICNPELLVSMLLCPPMDHNEAIVITGAERFSIYTGYTRAVKWEGDYTDKEARDEDGSVTTSVVAIDALMHPMDGA